MSWLPIQPDTCYILQDSTRYFMLLARLSGGVITCHSLAVETSYVAFIYLHVGAICDHLTPLRIQDLKKHTRTLKFCTIFGNDMCTALDWK